MSTSNPPAVGTSSFLEGLTLETVVDVSSIPSAHSSHTSEETEEADPKALKKRARIEVDSEEVTSSLSGSAKRQELETQFLSCPYLLRLRLGVLTLLACLDLLPGNSSF